MGDCFEQQDIISVRLPTHSGVYHSLSHCLFTSVSMLLSACELWGSQITTPWTCLYRKEALALSA